MGKDTQMEEVRVAVESLQESYKESNVIVNRITPLIDIDPAEIAEIEELVRKTIMENLDNMEADEDVKNDERFMETLVNVKMNSILRGESNAGLEYYREKIEAAKR